jgi:hypothetical protein
MRWWLLQLAVFFGVFAFFTETGLGEGHGIAPVALSMGMAWLVTFIASKAIDLFRRSKNALLVQRKHRT